MSPEDGRDALEMQTVRCRDGSRLELLLAGEGPLLLLLHGWALDHRSFAPQWEGLAGALRVATYDRRGFGASCAAPDLDAELDDIDAVLDHLGAARCHLLGVSQGGRLALRYASRRPERLTSLILQGAVLDGFQAEEGPGEALPLDAWRALAAAGRIDEVRRQWLAHPLMSAGITDPALREALAGIVADYPGTDLTSNAAGSIRAEPGTLAKLDLPTLLITGALETRARKAHARHLLALLPGASEIAMPASGHLSNLSEPGRYNTTVLAFVREAERAD
jgi:pimeloyl-ACP methyl ester carboxylesterase